MNVQRRKAIEAVQKIITTLQDEMETLASKAQNAVDELESIKEEEQEYYDNMPENMQNGDKGSTAQSAIDSLDSAIEYLAEVQDFADKFSEAGGACEEAVSA